MAKTRDPERQSHLKAISINGKIACHSLDCTWFANSCLLCTFKRTYSQKLGVDDTCFALAVTMAVWRVCVCVCYVWHVASTGEWRMTNGASAFTVRSATFSAILIIFCCCFWYFFLLVSCTLVFHWQLKCNNNYLCCNANACTCMSTNTYLHRCSYILI